MNIRWHHHHRNRRRVCVTSIAEGPFLAIFGASTVDQVVVSLVLPAMFGLGALAMAALAVAAFKKTRRWRTEGVTVEGAVVGFVERELPPRENLSERDERVQKFSPVLSFVAGDGNTYQFTASAAEPFGASTLGQRLPVRYLASSPAEADLEKMAVSNVPGVAFTILAILAGTVAVVVFNAARSP